MPLSWVKIGTLSTVVGQKWKMCVEHRILGIVETIQNQSVKITKPHVNGTWHHSFYLACQCFSSVLTQLCAFAIPTPSWRQTREKWQVIKIMEKYPLISRRGKIGEDQPIRKNSTNWTYGRASDLVTDFPHVKFYSKLQSLKQPKDYHSWLSLSIWSKFSPCANSSRTNRSGLQSALFQTNYYCHLSTIKKVSEQLKYAYFRLE